MDDPVAEAARDGMPAPRQGDVHTGEIYHIHPHLAGGPGGWTRWIDHAAELGFRAVLLAPPFATGALRDAYRTARHDVLDAEMGGAPALAALHGFAANAVAAGLTPLLDLSIGLLDPQAPLVIDHPDWFASGPDGARCRFELGGDDRIDWWDARIEAFQDAGIRGFRCVAAHLVPAEVWVRLIAAAHARDPSVRFIAETWGGRPVQVEALATAGFDFTLASSCFWDFAAPWLDEDVERLRRIAPLLAMPRAPVAEEVLEPGDPLGAGAWRRALRFAGALGAGWILPMGCEFGRLADFARPAVGPDGFAMLLEGVGADLGAEVRAINEWRHATPSLFEGGLRRLSPPWSDIAAFARGSLRRPGAVIVANADAARGSLLDPLPLLRRLATNGGLSRIDEAPAEDAAVLGADSAPVTLAPAETQIFRPVPRQAAKRPVPRAQAVQRAVAAPRIGIERIEPTVADGTFPVKRIVGERVTVELDLICDGHDHLAGDLLFRVEDEGAWRRAPLVPLGNDRWQAAFPLARMGRHLFSVEAWRDRFGSFAEEIGKKHGAGVPIALELIEGVAMVDDAIAHAEAEPDLAPRRAHLQALKARLDAADEDGRRIALLDPATVALMRAAEPRRFLSRLDKPLIVDAERREAAFASWYEVFPRSQSFDESRHGNFDDVIVQLPRVRDMGFDVLYFPPIHPIGRKNRKGRNNTLTPAPDDPGSPYAIGASEGGHDALHRELGTLEDFQRLIDAAAAHGIEIAIDFAIQCSPDHPWLAEHPEWFDWRPDGTIKYAENPPKKYEDIVNVDFYAEGAMPSLWRALRDVVLFWAARGVRLFRVDNPHTKPLPFWEWMIAEVRARYPDAIFLAEAFTRPKMMMRLAKIGFAQSYTYFTWRNTAAELRDYMEELAHGPAREFFRPHFFVNTPDINPHFLQASGRAGFLIRAALAATLSGLWGVYNGFELCEADALPGREEYLDSEKYQLRAWDLDRPGNIIAEITALNRIRAANPALQDHRFIEFLPVSDPDVLYFLKTDPERTNALLVAISTDPHRVIDATIELPLRRFDLADDGVLQAEDLMRGVGFAWHGRHQPVRLDPAEVPFCIWRVRR